MDMKRILQALDNSSTQPVEGANDMKKFLQVVNEGANPHKVALPVQMAMQHYQKPKETKKASLLEKYVVQVEQEQTEAQEQKQQLLKQYSQTIAERVLMKENTISEVPIEPSGDPNDPTIYGHEKANPMSLQGRIQQARNQLTQLSHMAQSNDLVVWEQICKLAKGGMFMGLEQNLEQIRHGIHELAAKRKKGGSQSRGIDKNIGK